MAALNGRRKRIEHRPGLGCPGEGCLPLTHRLRGLPGVGGEGWVEIFNVLTPRWGWKRDISQPVARGVVSVARKAAFLCMRDTDLRRMS